MAAVIRYFINPDEWCEKHKIGCALKSLINSLEYKILTDQRYEPHDYHDSVIEPQWISVYTLEPAPHWFQGGAILVGSTDMVPAYNEIDGAVDVNLFHNAMNAGCL